MQVDTGHRHTSQALTMQDYDHALSCLTRMLPTLNFLRSSILCGSLVKGDVIPGWSDIDLLLITHRDTLDLEESLALSMTLACDPLIARIGVGLSVVGYEALLRTRKFGGSPYMMTYEVAIYGKVLTGDDVLKSFNYDSSAHSAVENERPLLIASAVNNWRRTFFRDYATQSAVHCVQLAAKALLVLLQLEIGPARHLPVNVDQSFSRLSKDNPSHEALPAFSRAIAIRETWPTYSDELIAKKDLPLLASALEHYPILLPPV